MQITEHLPANDLLKYQSWVFWKHTEESEVFNLAALKGIKKTLQVTQ